MKKTEKTALTAAMLTAALNMLPAGTACNSAENSPLTASAYEQSAKKTTAAPEEAATIPAAEFIGDPVATIPDDYICVYGPPPGFWDDKDDEDKPTYDDFAPVYGPPPVLKGDFVQDGKVNSFDMVAARKLLVEGMSGYDSAFDMNDDGEFTIADLVALNRYIMGKDQTVSEEPVTTRQPQPIMTTTTMMYPVYGPAPAWATTETTAVPEPVEDEGKLYPVYGAPVADDRNTTTTAVPEE